MRLPFLRSKDDPATERARASLAAGDATLAGDAAVQAARKRARQRLLGALVLLAVGVVGFPLLFETEPRPLPADVPIGLSREGVALDGGAAGRVSGRTTEAPAAEPAAAQGPVGQEVAQAASAAAPIASTPQQAVDLAAAPAVTTGTAGTAATGQAAAVAAAPASAAAVPAMPKAAAPAASAVPAAGQPAVKPELKPAARPDAKADGRPPAAVTKSAPAAPAAASPASASPGAASPEAPGRFVVQAGAYADPSSLRTARQKVEKLGLKTYIQVIESNGAKRTRVRVGPYATRQEAEAAAARIKATGLAVSVIAL